MPFRERASRGQGGRAGIPAPQDRSAETQSARLDPPACGIDFADRAKPALREKTGTIQRYIVFENEPGKRYTSLESLELTLSSSSPAGSIIHGWATSPSEVPFRSFGAMLGAAYDATPDTKPSSDVKDKAPSGLEYQGNGYWYDKGKDQYYARDAHSKDLRPADAPDRIYLVGEGDFSFALSQATRWAGYPVVIKATAYEERKAVESREEARANIAKLEAMGVRLQFGVDATQLDAEPVSPRPVDKLGFVFPHAGGGGSNASDIELYEKNNSALLSMFLRSGRGKLAAEGSAFTVMKNTQPYARVTAKFPGYAGEHKYALEERGFKHPKGYTHVQTASSAPVTDKKHARLFIFTKPPESGSPGATGGKAEKKEDGGTA